MLLRWSSNGPLHVASVDVDVFITAVVVHFLDFVSCIDTTSVPLSPSLCRIHLFKCFSCFTCFSVIQLSGPSFCSTICTSFSYFIHSETLNEISLCCQKSVFSALKSVTTPSVLCPNGLLLLAAACCYYCSRINHLL